MRSSIFIISILAIAVTAAPTPAPASECKRHCCQTLQLPDSSPMLRLLESLSIPRSDITGLIGIGCSAGACPTRIVGTPACCTGPTTDRTVTSGCEPANP